MESNPMRQEWTQLILWLGGMTIIGLIFSAPMTGLLIGLAGYLVWYLRNLRRLILWLQGRSAGLPENAAGVWGEIYYWLYRLRRRDRRRKKRMSSALSRFRESTAALPDAVVALGEGELIEWWNPLAKRLLGFRSKQDIGQPITNLIRHPEFIRFIAAGDESEALILRSPVDESVILSIRLVRYGKKQSLLIAQDVTRLHRLEQMRSDFVANVSHELRTPLTVISGYLETIKSDTQLPEALKGAIEAMDSQSQRLRRIVSDLLLLSQLESDAGTRHEEDIDIHGLLSMVCDDARALSHGRHTIELKLDSASGLHGNRDELRSAFSNLVYNAVHYVPEGGHINVSWSEDSRGLHMCVEDDGPGIPAQHLPRLTERFYRIDAGRSRDQGGTGLGLAIVKHVLMKLHGELLIESESGKGSRFCCYFPLTAGTGSLS
jgi:two-component system phosphate regulon sensor histidine kinase PhoR